MNKTMATAMILILALAMGALGCAVEVPPPVVNVYDTAPPAYDTGSAKGAPMFEDGDESEFPRGGAPPKEGWQIDGELVTGDPTGDVFLQANFMKTGVYTVQISTPLLPPDGPPFFASCGPIAEIFWKVEGGLIRREVSVGNGVSLSAPAQGVEVHVHDASSFGAPGGKYGVHIQVTRGVRATASTPPGRIPDFPFAGIVLLPSLASITIPVPPNAGIISVDVNVGNFTGAPITGIMVEQIEGVATINVYDPTVATGFVPLKAGSSAVKITNYSLVSVDVGATFGVDG